MKTTIVILTSIVLCACSSIPKKELVVIRCLDRPLGEFSIGGEKPFKMNEFEVKLKEFVKENSDISFDFVAEIKLRTKMTEKIKLILFRAGVKVNSFWVPTSEMTQMKSPYGHGYINFN